MWRCGLRYWIVGVVVVMWFCHGPSESRSAVASRRLSTNLPPSSPGADVPQAWAARVAQPPVMDGRLDDECWSATRPIRLGRLDRFGAAAPRTEARFVYNDQTLFVGVWLEEPNIERLRRKFVKVDQDAWQDDSVELFLMPDPRQGYFQIVVGAGGAVYDRRNRNDPAEWNSQTIVAVAVDKQSWTIEAAIPLAALGATKQMPERWRVNVYRNRFAGGAAENQAWSPTFRNDYDVPDRFGQLLFAAKPPWAPQQDKPGELGQIRVRHVGDGQAVLEFDLSGLPKGAKVYRASLKCERRAPHPADPAALAEIEIYPLAAPYKQGDWPEHQQAALRLEAPWFRSFDVTDLVSQWLSGGRPNYGLYVKVFPGWLPEKTVLDVLYEGQPDRPPPQASGLRVLHRAGQTFVTFREVETLLASSTPTWGEIKQALAGNFNACTYCIYRHDKPITADNVGQAQLLAEIGPLSAYNVNGRNMEYLIGQAMIQPDEIGELARDYNGYMYSWTMDHPRTDRYPTPRLVIEPGGEPLPPGVGLYVHNPTTAGRWYYAVVSCRNGVQNTVDFSAANSLEQPVTESVGPGEPVLQGKGLWGPYFDYPGTRWVYVQWCAPPLAPQPNMYFNYSVLIPPNVSGKTALELYFHPQGYSYAQPGKKLLRDSIQIAPHDYPPSGWYGFNDAAGTLRPLASGTVRNHTQQRIVAFCQWAERNLPIDPQRVIAVGADGAALLALNYPQMFAKVWITGFDRHGEPPGPEQLRALAEAWGPCSDKVYDDRGRNNWQWAELDKLVLEARGDLPLFCCRGPSWCKIEGYGKGQGKFYAAMLQARQPLQAGWGWEATRNLEPIDWYTGAWRGMMLRSDSPVMAVSNASNDTDKESSGLAGGGARWKDLLDAADGFSVTLLFPSDCTFDLTPRRLKHFRPQPKEVLSYRAETLPSQAGQSAQHQSGQVMADAQGQFTISGLRYLGRSAGLKIVVGRSRASP